MQKLTAGSNVALANQTRTTVTINWSPEKIAGYDVDASAFLLTAQGKVRFDADFIFYNQPQAADGTVRISGGGTQSFFDIQLERLPSPIEKISFALTIHGPGTFAQAKSLFIQVDGEVQFAPDHTIMTEGALILGELYRHKGEWKFRAVGQGFNGGLAPLASHFGVDVGEESSSSKPSTSQPAATSLETKLISLKKEAPQLVDLAKKAQVILKKKGLDEHIAAVGLCLDTSYSMSGMFGNGTVQTVIERVMGLGINFDDNGAIDVFGFHDQAKDLGELEPKNFRDAAQWVLKKTGMGGTSYAPAIQTIMNHYGFSLDQKVATNTGTIPAYILFVTDGDCSDHSETERLIRAASHYPVFFQFVGVGGGGFNFLERLDDMSGRFIDNANFFSVENPANISESELYDRMMVEYPEWVKEAKMKGLIN